MSLTIKFFYFLSIFFLYVEIFGFFKRETIYKPVSELELETPFRHFIFYFFKLVYLPWLVIGLLTHNWTLFSIPILAGLINLLSLKTQNNFIINIFRGLNFIVSCISLIFILCRAIFQ